MKKDELTLTNFRELGGLATTDGSTIKKGKIYRTAAFLPKTEADRRYIEAMHLNSVIDLRSAPEVAEAPDVLPKGVKWVAAPVFVDERFSRLIPTKAEQRKLFFAKDAYVHEWYDVMHEAYSYFPYAHQAYSCLFVALSRGDTLAFHCTAGKDRTGVGALLVELALGRSIEDAKAQYLVSNVTREAMNNRLDKALSLVPMSKTKKDFAGYSMRVHNELIDLSLDAIFSHYDTIEDFYLAEYGISNADLDKWKQFYLD